MRTDIIKKYLFWYSTKILGDLDYENFGDYLGKIIYEEITGKKAVWINPIDVKWYHLSKIYFTVGSILHFINKHCCIWGSGIIKEDLIIKPATFYAVRGPKTRNKLLKLGYDVPEIYGDPALLMPRFLPLNNPIKKHKLGIIPHVCDYDLVKNKLSGIKDIKIINLKLNYQTVIEDIVSCETTLSSSLHGIIISHAYNVPSLRTVFSNLIYGDGIKYIDYFESVEITPYNPINLESKVNPSKINEFIMNQTKINCIQNNLTNIQEELLASCPFK